MTGPQDVVGSLFAAVTTYQTAVDTMIEAGRALTEETDQTVPATDGSDEGADDGGIPA